MLGLDETASVEELVSAFRVRIRAVHPDHHDGGGDRETLELLVRARQTLTGADRASYLAARAAQATASPGPATSRPSSARPSAASDPADDLMSRWAAAAQRSRGAWPPRAPQAAPSTAADDAVREAVRQAAATRGEVRRTTAPTVDIPVRPFTPYQPHPRPVPKPRVVRFTKTPYVQPRYHQPEYQSQVNRPLHPSTTRKTEGY